MKEQVCEAAKDYQSYCENSGADERKIEMLMDEVITHEKMLANILLTKGRFQTHFDGFSKKFKMC